MGKIKAWYRSVPIWLTVFLFAAAALILASFVSNKVIDTAYDGMTGLKVGYMVITPGRALTREGTYYAVRPEGEETPAPEDGADVAVVPSDTGENQYYETQWMNVTLEPMSEEDSRRYRALEQLTRYAPFVIYSAAFLGAALLFYFTKLKKPLALLQTASAKIADNELDFALDYAGRDEMAALCAAFEKMRSALDENSRRMLRMLDERKQLNDAYTHDLRTPIAVLKGYTDMLGRYLPAGRMPPEEVIETVHTMSAHVARLEQFVNSMNAAQRIADLTVRRESVPAGELVCGLRETAAFLCGERGLAWEVESRVEGGTLNIDPATVTQVFENLLGNAVRFAASRVEVELDSDGQSLTLLVADDGPGFTGKELVSAAKPYFSGQRQEAGTYHFGLGLHICRTLCEKHGGSLTLSNAPEGGAAVTAVFAL